MNASACTADFFEPNLRYIFRYSQNSKTSDISSTRARQFLDFQTRLHLFGQSKQPIIENNITDTFHEICIA